MKTASWFTHGMAAGRISISLGTPRAQPAGFRIYRPLNPTRAMLQLPTRAAYEEAYFRHLATLSPARVWGELNQMAPPGAEPVILCYERPPFHEGNWCHRRMVAAWFEATLGHVVEELNYSGPDVPLTLDPRVGRDI